MTEHAFWELRRIALVGWYLFGARDIDVRGAIALTGPNGAGKSSILDAIQTVLTARSGRYLQLNGLVQPDRSGRRTVRDYCLGAIDDADDGHAFVRSQSISYLMLGFRRTSDRREVTVGLCLSAREDAPVEDVLARFIFEGRILSVADVSDSGTDASGNWTSARTWASVAAKLLIEPGTVLTVESGPEMFVRRMCKVLGPDTVLIDPAKFLRNLRNTAAFKPVGNPTEFVRSFILPADIVNLSGLRDSIGRFRDIRARIAQTKARAAEAADLVQRAEKVHTRQRTLFQHQITVARGRIHLSSSSAIGARTERDSTRAALEALDEKLPGLEERVANLQATADEARARVASSATAREIERLEARAELLEERERGLRNRLDEVGRQIREISSLAPLVEPVSPEASRYLSEIVVDDDAAEFALSLPGSRLHKALQAASVAAGAAIGAAAATGSAVARRLEDLEGALERVHAGGQPIGRSTQALVDALASQGIRATPICAGVDDVKARWRPVVEAILGESREALVVPPDRYIDALATYRRMDVVGAQIVDTTKTKGTRAAKKDTLATAVSTKDPHIRAFLDYRLGHIVMVEDEHGMAREESAASADLMFLSGRTVRRLRPPARMMLGRAVTAGMADSIMAEVADARREAAEAATGMERATAVARACEKVLGVIETLDVDTIRSVMLEAAETEREFVDNGREIDALQASGNDGAKQRLSDAESHLGVANADLRKLLERRAGLSERLVAREAAVVAREAEDERLRAAARALLEQARPVLAAEEIADAEAWLSEGVPDAPETAASMAELDAGDGGSKPKDSSLGALLDHIEGYLVTYHAKRLDSERPSVVMRAVGYATTHGLPRPEFADDDGMGIVERFAAAEAWARSEVNNLENLVLKDYEDQAAEAYAEAVRQFQGDFVGRMRGAFEAMGGRLRELNRQLARRDFHGLVYRFDRKPAAAYKDLIALVDMPPPEGELDFSGLDRDADDPIARAIRKLEEVSLDPTVALEDLEDPRRYFEFDLAMDKGGVERTTMSKRLGTGSGGQVQVPFYVAICAALASTAYPDRAGVDGGIALAIFDEAFNRMDTAVIAEVMGLMGDVGLQPFIAAPDKERGTFIQFVETVISLSRAGKALSLDVQYVKEHAHRRFAEENPAIVGFPGFVKRMASEAKEAAD